MTSQGPKYNFVPAPQILSVTPDGGKGWWWERLVVGKVGGGKGWWWERLVVGKVGGGKGWWWERLVMQKWSGGGSSEEVVEVGLLPGGGARRVR